MKRSLIAGGFLAAALTWSAWGPTVVRAADSELTAMDESHFLLAAETAVKDGDRDGAIQLYHSAIIYAPGDPVPYERLAELFVKNGQNELAQQFFSLALDVQPAYAPALQGLALLDLAVGNRAGAEAQREILMRACGATCPETAQVEKALAAGRAP
jgi:tetratricopeptide (TPR) repeat protein